VIRAVLDTNQLVSMLIRPGGVADQIRRAWQDQRFVLLTSPALLEEFRRVLTYPKLRRSIRLTTEQERILIQLVMDEAEITPGTLEVHVVAADPADDAVVACAIEGQAGYIVSGDAHLLDFREQAGISIVSARTFLEILNRESPPIRS